MIRTTANQAYPEHEKLHKVAKESQAIGEFLDAMGSEGIFLARHAKGRIYPVPLSESIERTLAKYFGVDLQRLDDEKRAMLKALRGEV